MLWCMASTRSVSPAVASIASRLMPRRSAERTRIFLINGKFCPDRWSKLKRRGQDPSQPRSKRSARAVRRPSFILWGAGADDQMK
jgi:hypothetical protein